MSSGGQTALTVVALSSALISGIGVAVLSHYMNRTKTNAEIDNLRVQTKKIRMELDYRVTGAAERIIYDSGESAALGYDFEGMGNQNWNFGEKGHGTLSFKDGVINIYRSDNNGKYEVRLKRYCSGDRNDSEILSKNLTISGKRHLRVSCEAKITESTHSLRFVLKSTPAQKWLTKEEFSISKKTWKPIEMFCELDPAVDCYLRIDDYDVGCIPSNLQIRKIVVAERGSGS